MVALYKRITTFTSFLERGFARRRERLKYVSELSLSCKTYLRLVPSPFKAVKNPLLLLVFNGGRLLSPFPLNGDRGFKCPNILFTSVGYMFLISLLVFNC